MGIPHITVALYIHYRGHWVTDGYCMYLVLVPWVLSIGDPWASLDMCVDATIDLRLLVAVSQVPPLALKLR